MKEPRVRLRKYAGEPYEKTWIAFCCFVLHERLRFNRPCIWYQHRGRRQAVLRVRAALLGSRRLLVLDSGPLEPLSHVLDPRTLPTLLIK